MRGGERRRARARGWEPRAWGFIACLALGLLAAPGAAQPTQPDSLAAATADSLAAEPDSLIVPSVPPPPSPPPLAEPVARPPRDRPPGRGSRVATIRCG